MTSIVLATTSLALYSLDVSLPQGCHLAFLKQFSRNKRIWPFGLFSIMKKIVSFGPILSKFQQNITSFYDISKKKLIYFGNFFLFSLYLAFFAI
jgi:hypothetical protein